VKRAIVYVRTSSEGQLDGHGPAMQEEACRAYAARHDLLVVRVAVEAISGTTAVRPVFAAIVESIAAGEADAILVADVSRLARALVTQEVLLAEAWQVGAEVHAADYGLIQQDDRDDPTRALLRQFHGMLAEWQKAELVSRLRRARRTSAPEGKRENVGAKPFGKDDRERAILQFMLTWHEQGTSHDAIARALNNRPGWHTRTGTAWTPRNVSRVLGRSS